jgi:hypothetical protein
MRLGPLGQPLEDGQSFDLFDSHATMADGVVESN